MSTQSISGYHITTAFMEQFNLEKLVSELKNSFPEIEIHEQSIDALKPHEHNHLKTLLEAIRVLNPKNVKPQVGDIINKLDYALKDFNDLALEQSKDLLTQLGEKTKTVD